MAWWHDIKRLYYSEKDFEYQPPEQDAETVTARLIFFNTVLGYWTVRYVDPKTNKEVKDTICSGEIVYEEVAGKIRLTNMRNRPHFGL